MTTGEADCDETLRNQPTEASAATVYLALGTNLGDREANLREAARRISQLGLTIMRRSSIYETEPVGFADQFWFLNQVIEVRLPRQLMFDLNQQEAARLKRRFDVETQTALTEQLILLLDALLKIEGAMGRRRVTVNDPRLIDIDILLCGEVKGVFGKMPKREAHDLQQFIPRTNDAALPQLILPHPRLHLRRFVLAPLCEIAPNVIHPTWQKTCSELLAALDDPAIVRLFRETD
ncbi:MAG: 2-amino-4-hydroxy-6-hydroxymethyldihydropteridine diphosphokinase [Blastocatellia bacterium]